MKDKESFSEKRLRAEMYNTQRLMGLVGLIVMNFLVTNLVLVLVMK